MKTNRFTKHLSLVLVMLLLMSNIMISSAESVSNQVMTDEVSETILPEEAAEEAPEDESAEQPLPEEEQPQPGLEETTEPLPVDEEIDEPIDEEEQPIEEADQPIEPVVEQPAAEEVTEEEPPQPVLPYMEEMTSLAFEKTWTNVPEGVFPTVTVEVNNAATGETVRSFDLTYDPANPVVLLEWHNLPYRDAAGQVIDYRIREIHPDYIFPSEPVITEGYIIPDSIMRVTPQSHMSWTVDPPHFIVVRPNPSLKQLVIWTLNRVDPADQAQFVADLLASAGGLAGNPPLSELADPSFELIWLYGPSVEYDGYPADPDKGLLTIQVLFDEDGKAVQVDLDFQKPSEWTMFVHGRYTSRLIQITNRYYVAKGSWYPEVAKQLLGRDLKEGEFSFELRLGDQVLQTVKNTQDGKVLFEPIEYDHTDIGKVYTYTIVEVAGELGGVTYDETIITVTVTIEDNGDGTLNITQEYSPTAVFKNTYAATGSWSPMVKKYLQGRPLKAGEFSFVLKQDDQVLQTKTNQAEGLVLFDEVVFTAPGTYHFTISEVAGDEDDMEYDETVHTITVEVTDNGDGTLKVVPSYDAPPEFKNIYSPRIDITATKKWVGGPDKKPVIQFQLYQNDKAYGAVVELDGVTSYTWKDLPKLDETGKEYKYTVKETVVPNYYKVSYSDDGLTVTNTWTKKELPETGMGNNLPLLLIGLTMVAGSGWLIARKKRQN